MEKSVARCSTNPRVRRWPSEWSEPTRSIRDWQSATDAVLRATSACSILEASSSMPSRLATFASWSRLHSPCSRTRSPTKPAAVSENSAFIALLDVTPRNAVKSLVSTRGIREWSRRRDSRTVWMHETSSCDGGRASSIAPEIRSKRSSTRTRTKRDRSSSVFITSPAADPSRDSGSFWNPSTASQRVGTYCLVARAHDAVRAPPWGASFWSAGSSAAAAAGFGAAAPLASLEAAEAVGSPMLKHLSRQARRAAARPLM
mmetsp:Transcript_67164/g.189217  ORF Transcript_67164/g.189217 Transcript_67164/m.189217 type:complete len:259 (+) Transcript_67164:517-1293(+)